MKKYIFGAILIVFLLTGRYVWAQAVNFSVSSGNTIEIDAEDGIEWDRVKKTISAMGKAIIKQGDMKLESAAIEAFYHDKQKPEIYKVVATKNVIFTSSDAKITGEEAIYDMEKKAIILKGNPAKLVKDNEKITADGSIEYFQNERKAIARGNAEVVSDGRKLSAETMEAYFIENKGKNLLELSSVKVVGSVKINTENEKITANQGLYDVKKAIATLMGNIVIAQKDNELRGERAEVNLKSGISRLIADKQGKQRVKGSFIPKK